MDPLNMLVGPRKSPPRSRFFYRSTSLTHTPSLPLSVTPDRPPATIPAPNPESGLRTWVMSAPPHASSLDKVLVARPMPKSLSQALNKLWMLTAERDRLLLNRLSKGGPIGASTNTGEGLLAYLTGLVSRGGKVTLGISILGVEEYGRVLHSHSLF